MNNFQIFIRGWAAVFQNEDQIIEPEVLRTLDGLTYEDEKFTDFIGGTEEEDNLVAVLESGGFLRFGYTPGSGLLDAITDYETRRRLSEAELRWLVDYTMGQWSDGIGENWEAISPERCGFSIMCLTPGDDVGPNYPKVEVVEKSPL
jgi:hypothetical protein